MIFLEMAMKVVNSGLHCLVESDLKASQSGRVVDL